MKGYYYFDDKLAQEEEDLGDRWEVASLIDKDILEPADHVIQIDEFLLAEIAACGYASEVIELLEERSGHCTHEWIDMTNEVIQSGEWCQKCNAIR